MRYFPQATMPIPRNKRPPPSVAPNFHGCASIQQHAPNPARHNVPTMKQTPMTRSTNSGLRAAGCSRGSFAASPDNETGVRCSSVIALPHPESEEREDPDAEGQSNESFRDRSETAQSKPAGVVGVLDLGRHVLHDVIDLCVTEVAGEARHVGGASADRLGDFDRRDLSKRR